MRVQPLTVNDNVERLLVVSDLHGFREPLDVLDGIFKACEGESVIVSTGDYVLIGVSPVYTVEWVMENSGEFALAGNHDRNVVERVEGEHPPYTEAGASQLLSEEQRQYLGNLPDILELSWRDKIIRITHCLTPMGECFSWRATTAEVFDAVVDTSVDLTVTAHTHCPFVRKNERGFVANCGATSGLMLAHKLKDGSIQSKTDVPFEPVSEIYSTYLVVTLDDGEVNATVEHFDFDREKEFKLLEDAGYDNLERIREWLTTGVLLTD